MNAQEIDKLIDRYLKGIATEEETALIEDWYINLVEKESLPPTNPNYELVKGRIWQNIKVSDKRHKILWPSYAAAAIILLAVSFGLYFYSLKEETAGQSKGSQIVYDVPSGKNTAVLTLANGRKIKLSDQKNGVVIAPVLTYSDGSKVYNNSELVKNNKTQFITASTPRGGTYQVQLPDGTKVWLNAASTLRFPSSFENNEFRNVELTGEAYFQVAKDRSHPFIVSTKQQNVRVLGTHFNINSYEEEPEVKTTLLEGSIQVAPHANISGRIIKPGQQASLAKSGEISINEVDADLAIAWKNSQFRFDGDNIQTIMRMVERWYNVEVVYTGEITDEKFIGETSRFENVSEVLKILESTGKVHFRIQGRKIYVSK